MCAAQGLVCDETALSSAETTSANALHAAVASSVACAPPYLTTCLDAGPKMSGLGSVATARTLVTSLRLLERSTHGRVLE